MTLGRPIQHISMRVPWRDQPWDDKVCEHPLDNSSCLLLKNIGGKRLDGWEADVAGRSFDELPQYDRLPCLSERGTFMAARGYAVEKHHPYRVNRALKGHLNPTEVSVPPYAFEAVPFRWLSREIVEDELWRDVAEYRPEHEDRVVRLVGFRPGWVMDARNQRALIDRFFENVTPEHSLVLIYLKHSPLQDESSRRLLVGAARVTDVRLPSLWNQSGDQPFDSSMWETIVRHSLRSDQGDGVLLPYQQLLPLVDDGHDVGAALAWAPENADNEFSYVTEHVSDDTAISALRSLRTAVDGLAELGVQVPRCAREWVDEQIDRLWRLRGPAPGMPAILSHLGVESAHRVVGRLMSEPDWGADPWGVLGRALDRRSPLGQELLGSLPPSVRHTWNGLTETDRKAMKILSAMDVTRGQVHDLLTERTSWAVSAAELVENPYYAATCTYRSRHPISLATADQACFPADHVRWANLIAELIGLDDPGDARRIEALIVDVLERLAEAGDTIAGETEALSMATEIPLTRPCPISQSLLRAYHLDAANLEDYGLWTPLVGAELHGQLPAYKLRHLAETGSELADQLRSRRSASRLEVAFDARAAIDELFGAAGLDDPVEELARSEKAAGLRELVASRVSVLVGPAGTGKTSLLRTLVARPEVSQDGVLLLAPTGKARVQMQTRINHSAQTLASFLIKKGGYDPDTGRYRSVDRSKRNRFGLVIIDEASMLTEEMLAAALSALEGVKRLVLVGDHRQLPPIGPGRPFVDLVEWLRPEQLDGPIRVGHGYVELTVSRRQRGSERDDLALARWFGGEDRPGAADAIWHQLRLGLESETVAYRQWGSEGVIDALVTAVETELGLPQSDERTREQFFAQTYGAKWNEQKQRLEWHTGEGGAGQGCESWQVLSPTRSRVFGTVELNRVIKQRYRAGDLNWTQNRYGYRPPKPMGPEQIVYGDKVMQTRNNSRAKAYPEGAGMNYLANGEIGVVVSRISEKPMYANVEFSSQVGATYGYKPSSAEDPWLELAWAVTVHKSQGSEFGTTFVVLPSRAPVSRELLYTALTRQTRKVIILHEGTVDELFALTSPALSETSRRMTDLFRPAAPRELTIGDRMRRFDGNLIHVAPGGILVRSKNEVIVATILDELVPERWSYERPLTIDGVTKYPDFTIDTATGDEVVWEHLGMMGNPTYAAEWAAKKAWYTAHGFRPYDEPDAPGHRGVLMWTDDQAGVNQPAWRQVARSVLGSTPRRATKKTVGKRE